METITWKVNGVELTSPAGLTILEAVRKADIKYAECDIPSLYYLKDVQETDESGICNVEIVGQGIVPAWSTTIAAGMEVLTDTEALVAQRKEILQKILAVHDHQCVDCSRTGNCELQQLLYQYEVDDGENAAYEAYPVDHSGIIVRDPNKCIRCGRCVTACAEIQSVYAIAKLGEGLEARVGPASPEGLQATKCVTCGQCITVCPVGALRERDDTDAVFAALADPKKFVIVQAAPAVRAALGEEFGFPLGVDVEGRLPAALRALGFDRVFDTKFGADMTILEEANELVERLQTGGPLPIMTSCCPGWVKFCEQDFPDLLPNLSSCKSPHEMFGAICKTYYAEQLGLDKEQIVVVSVMPCTAKKFEITRPDENAAGVPDVDYALTTRELARMLERAEIQFEAMPSAQFDMPLGVGTGAGVIFGATGGVMEAALRTAVATLTGQQPAELEFTEVRGVAGIKEASYQVAGTTVKVAVTSGLANARALLEQVRSGRADYQFIEVMACPGGCVNGGGQPIQMSDVRSKNDLRAVRAEALYSNDRSAAVRTSHENEALQQVYADYLGQPGSARAHQLLHTTYVDRSGML